MERIRQQKETIKTAAAGIGALLKLPRYNVLAAGFSLLFAIVIFFAINSNFYGPLFLSRLSIADKFAVAGNMLAELFKQGFTTPNGALLLIVSILQGLSLSVVIFTARRNKRNEQDVARQLSVSGIASIAAAIGLGCVRHLVNLANCYSVFLGRSGCYRRQCRWYYRTNLSTCT